MGVGKAVRSWYALVERVRKVNRRFQKTSLRTCRVILTTCLVVGVALQSAACQAVEAFEPSRQHMIGVDSL